MALELMEVIRVTNAYQLEIAKLQQENAALKKELEAMKKSEKGKVNG